MASRGKPGKGTTSKGTGAGIEAAFGSAVQRMRAGRLAEADALCRNILKADPLFAEAMHLQGIIALQAGQPDRAIQLIERFVVLRPQAASAYSDLGMIYNGLGRFETAAKHLQKALTIDPGLAGAHVNLGNVFSALGQPAQAEPHYRRAVELQPKLAGGYNNLSRTLLVLGRDAEAAQIARKAVARDPRNALAQNSLAAALERLGQHGPAATARQKALSLAPNDQAIRLAHADALTGRGELKAAADQYRTVLAANPDSAHALAKLTMLGADGGTPDRLAHMQELFEAETTSDPDKAQLGFAIGKALEEHEDYPKSFAYVARANALARKSFPYRRAATDRRFDETMAAYTPELFARLQGVGDPDPTPIFVIGMPRSGTSLIEQILASHPDVAGAGELSILRDLAGELRQAKPGAGLGQSLAQTPPERFAAIGHAYIERARAYAPNARFIVDKMPANFFHVGLIRLILPNARIVHSRRDAADTCVSIFKTGFDAGTLPYAYDMADIAHYYRRYTVLMAHWRTLLPGAFLDSDYEALVADQRAGSERLLAHCGLDWNDAVLDFFKNKHPVHTASAAQVRQPIYSGSVGLAHKYGDAVAPLLKALGPAATGSTDAS